MKALAVLIFLLCVTGGFALNQRASAAKRGQRKIKRQGSTDPNFGEPYLLITAYNDKNISKYTNYDVYGSLPVDFSGLNTKKKYLIIVPGMSGGGAYYDDLISRFVNAYNLDHYGFLFVDWVVSDFLTNGTTDLAASKGSLFAKALEELFRTPQFKFDRIVTHQIGSVLLASATMNSSSLKISRVMVLDPFKDKEYEISPNMAQLVEVIHTSGNTTGVMKTLGHRDFYPNGGTSPQPICSDNDCDNSVAYKYFINAFSHGYMYEAVHCKSYESFLKGNCFRNPRVQLNNNEPLKKYPTGKYYLKVLQPKK